MKITSEQIVERIETVKAQIEKYNEGRRSKRFGGRKEEPLKYVSGVKMEMYSGLTPNPHLDFYISRIGNLDMIELRNQLNRVLRPFSLRVKELRLFVPERGQNYLSVWVPLQWFGQK